LQMNQAAADAATLVDTAILVAGTGHGTAFRAGHAQSMVGFLQTDGWEGDRRSAFCEGPFMQVVQ
jgi:hypothetical protein